MKTCRISLLGSFRVEIDGEVLAADAWRHRRGAELVKLLALTPRHQIHRDELIEALWPDLTPQAGAANLRKAVHFARRALGGEWAIGVARGILQLCPGVNLVVDAEVFERTATEALRRNDAGEAAEAWRHYTGDLLPEDLYAEWAHEPRRRLQRLYLETLRASGMWERVIDADPTDEAAHRELMRAHLDAGNRQAAMRQFERLRDALHRELGVGPDPQTVALYEDILAREGTEPSTPAERAAAHLSAGLVALSRMDLEEAERQARLARGLAIEAGTAREVGEASGLLGMVAHSRSSWPDLFLEEFELVVQDTPDVAGAVFDAHLCLAEFSLMGNEGPEAIATYAHQLLEIAERFDSVPGRALARLILGESKLFAGDLEGAEEDLSQAAQLHSEAGAASGRTLAVLRLAEVAVAAGQQPRARRLVADAHALASGSSLESHLLVRAYGTQVQAAGDPAAAAEQALSARDDLAAREVCPPCSIGFLVASAIACARALRGGDASGFLDQAERAAGMWQGGPWLAAVWEARAELRLAVGEGRQAAAFFREAADLFARSGHRLAEARCNSASERSSGLGRPGNGRGTSHS